MTIQNGTRFTMVSPSAGFTSRVMTRIAERERAQARRRAMIGSALLVVAAIIIVALIVLWLVSWIAVFVTMPQVLVSILNALSTMTFWTGVAMNGITDAAQVIVQNVGISQMLSLAVVVCALTALWLRVVADSSFASQTINLGGSK